MKREKRVISEEILKNLCVFEGEDDNYVTMADKPEIIDFDGEKGYTEQEMVIMEKATKLYFKVIFEEWGQGEYEFPTEVEQVFKVTKKIVTYE